MKRAIAISGGGPAVGLSIGTLKRLEESGITFDVWALSCIGAWLGVAYNQAEEGQGITASVDFFRKIFRDDRTYSHFPIPTVFAPDFIEETQRTLSYMMDPGNYRNLFMPDKITQAMETTWSMMRNPRSWNRGDFNSWMLNQVLAVNPFSRFLTGMMFQNKVKGLARIFYPDSSFLRSLDFDRLNGPEKPFLYYNAYNITQERLELFANKPMAGYGKVSPQTLCACSALPYIEEPVQLGDDFYCEGATVDTVNFKRLLEDHPDLDEIWVSRVLDYGQIHSPENLYDSLNNLIMLFATTTSEHNVQIFRQHAADVGWKGKIVEIAVSPRINYDWSHSNLGHSIAEGYAATDRVVAQYLKERLQAGQSHHPHPRMPLADRDMLALHPFDPAFDPAFGHVSHIAEQCLGA